MYGSHLTELDVGAFDPFAVQVRFYVYVLFV